MLTTIGRAAVRRVVTRGPKSTNRALQSLWQLQRVNNLYSINKSSNDTRKFSSSSRSYRIAAAETPASSKPKTKTATKKAAPKKAATKKPIKKKVAKKAKPKAKKAPKKKVKKVLTEAEKLKVHLKALKATALVIPKKLAETVNTVIVAEVTQGANGTFADAIAKYKALTPAEVEHYNHIVNQNKAANAIAYKKWVEEHTPDQIREANNARKQLKREVKSSKTWPLIEDPRQPKQPLSPFAIFTKERFNSGDFKGIKFSETGKLVASEFKALSPSEKKKYEDIFLADHHRYVQEYKTVFNRESKAVQNIS